MYGVLVWAYYLVISRAFFLRTSRRVRGDVVCSNGTKNFTEMNQDQYLQLRAARPYLDQYHAVGSVSIPHDVAQMMQKVHGELYGGGFNNWCQACVIEALTKLMVAFDNYETKSAPVIVSAGQTAKANVTKRSRKRNSNPD
jgi:hypothetical protein